MFHNLIFIFESDSFSIYFLFASLQERRLSNFLQMFDHLRFSTDQTHFYFLFQNDPKITKKEYRVNVAVRKFINSTTMLDTILPRTLIELSIIYSHRSLTMFLIIFPFSLVDIAIFIMV